VHWQAGALLRRFHGAAPSADAAAGVERAADRAAEHLRRADGMLTAQQMALVHRSADLLRSFASDLSAVATHGDSQPRNWLWDASSRRLALIDFERAELAPAIRDLVRLEFGPWDGRPDLRDTFFKGYGRPLTDVELEALPCLGALDALSGLQWGTANHDQEVADRARRTFDRLTS
jgi:Ser/Thr protein kinase RdoA (MazF antagonist)